MPRNEPFPLHEESAAAGNSALGRVEDGHSYVESMLNRLDALLSNKKRQRTLELIELEEIALANTLARLAGTLALHKPTKENFEMAIKLGEHSRKAKSGACVAAASLAKKGGVGIGSRMRSLMKKTDGVIEEAIAETERRREAAAAAPDGSASE